MRLGHFFLKLKHYNNEKETENRVYLETVRLQTTALINIQLSVNKRIKPSDLWSLPWDTSEQKSLRQLSAAEIEKEINEFEQQIENRLNETRNNKS